METIYKVNIVRGQMAFTVESQDKGWVEARTKEYLQMLAKWLNEAAPETQSHSRQSTSKSLPRGSMSPNEFYRAYIHSKITSRPDIATFFVYYLEKIQKKTVSIQLEYRTNVKDSGNFNSMKHSSSWEGRAPAGCHA